ncbi:MAG: hypothetical protein J6O71_05635 [Lachnospiraceae bacterium]|nr:hypothetical protein [Lachnospiraceae bacterium]
MKSFKKITALVLSLALTFTSGTVCFAETPTADTPADQKVFVTFVYGGNTKGEWVVKGTNVTPPAVPVIGGSTFCGWSSPLTNIQATQHIYAVYKPNFLGEAAIEATKKSLPAPAISATNVADPNAVAIATPIALSANGATPSAAQMQLLMAMLAQQQAAGVTAPAAATATTATTKVSTPATTAATPAATTPAAATPAATAVTTPAASTTTTTAATTAAPAAAATGTINFTDKDGNAGTFTQKEWNTLLNVYGGSEAVLRKHSLGDLKKVAAYYGG